MTGAIIAVAIAFVALLWVLTAARRRGIHRAPVISVRYTDRDQVDGERG